VKMNVSITDQDIANGGIGNSNDPLCLALARETGRSGWRVEVYSHGHRLRRGGAWISQEGQVSDYSIDEETTAALQENDAGNPMAPRTAVLTPVRD
jgi:hypothetical protein